MSNATGEAMDAELLAEFLTECGELLDQLDVDLVALEANPGERERIDRENQVIDQPRANKQLGHRAEDACDSLVASSGFSRPIRTPMICRSC